jgi:Icc-related predicted phosphoesterase
MRRLRFLSICLCSIACPAEKKPDPKPAETKLPPAKADRGDPSPASSSDPACIAPWSTSGQPRTLAAGARTFEITGSQLVEKSTDPDAKTVIGVLANIKEDTPENLKNVESFLRIFEDAAVDAIVIVGDLGETRDQIVNVVAPIAKAGVPVFAVIGNREKRSDFNDALASFGDSPVVNMNLVRLAVLDDVAFVSVPGYHDRAFIHAAEGCQYLPADLEATKPIIAHAGSKPIVLLSHGGPRQEGADALDRTLEQANVGDPGLTKLIRESGTRFGVFPNIQEAGGRATDLTGTKLIAEKTPSEELFVNPGPVDSVSWPMNDGTRTIGMAAVLTIDEKKASFVTHRIQESE